MKVNIFEAARRVSKFVAAIWIVGWMIKALNSNMVGNPITFASVVFGGVILILVVTSIIGWIVRKLMSIPRGKDSRC